MDINNINMFSSIIHQLSEINKKLDILIDIKTKKSEDINNDVIPDMGEPEERTHE